MNGSLFQSEPARLSFKVCSNRLKSTNIDYLSVSFRLNTDVTLKLQQKCPESSHEFSRNRSFLRPSRKAFTTAR